MCTWGTVPKKMYSCRLFFFVILSPRPLFPVPYLWLVDLWKTWDSVSHLLFIYWLKALSGEIQVLFIQYGLAKNVRNTISSDFIFQYVARI